MSNTLLTAQQVSDELHALRNPSIAEHSQRFFKTGPGEYAEGDCCLGIRVPVLRKVAAQAREMSGSENLKLLASPWHEERLTALFILIRRYQKGSTSEQESIYRAYLDNTKHINNWDLVDSSAHLIVGAHLFDQDRSILRELAASDLLWERRIAMIATLQFIRNGQFDDTLELAHQLLHDSHDLIHKAVGWMLREVGNRNRELETMFLDSHYQEMPRIMLRYAIERYPEPERQAYLKGRRASVDPKRVPPTA